MSLMRLIENCNSDSIYIPEPLFSLYSLGSDRREYGVSYSASIFGSRVRCRDILCMEQLPSTGTLIYRAVSVQQTEFKWSCHSIFLPSTSRSTQLSLSFWLFHEVLTFLFSHAFYMFCPFHPPRLDHSNYIWLKIQVMKYNCNWNIFRCVQYLTNTRRNV
jgi:hypothetical protein